MRARNRGVAPTWRWRRCRPRGIYPGQQGWPPNLRGRRAWTDILMHRERARPVFQRCSAVQPCVAHGARGRRGPWDRGPRDRTPRPWFERYCTFCFHPPREECFRGRLTDESSRSDGSGTWGNKRSTLYCAGKGLRCGCVLGKRGGRGSVMGFDTDLPRQGIAPRRRESMSATPERRGSATGHRPFLLICLLPAGIRRHGKLRLPHGAVVVTTDRGYEAVPSKGMYLAGPPGSRQEIRDQLATLLRGGTRPASVYRGCEQTSSFGRAFVPTHAGPPSRPWATE